MPLFAWLGILAALGQMAAAAGSAVGSAAGAVGSALGSAASAVGPAVGGALKGAAGAVTPALQSAVHGVGSAAQGLGSAAQSAGQGIMGAAKGVGNALWGGGKGAAQPMMTSMLGGGGGGGGGGGAPGQAPTPRTVSAQPLPAITPEAPYAPALRAPTMTGSPWIPREAAVSQMPEISQMAAGPGGSAPGKPGSQMPENRGKKMLGQISGLMGSMKGEGPKPQPYVPPELAPFQAMPGMPQIPGAMPWSPSRGTASPEGAAPWWWYLAKMRGGM